MARVPVVIDTNVCIVSNRRLGEPLGCASNCARQLNAVTKSGILVIDSLGLIFAEYRRHLSFRGEPGAGDRFFKWLVDNRYKPERVVSIAITPCSAELGSFDEFPGDPELAGFHLDDRVFVAIALTHPDKPRVINAVDSDYWHHRHALAKHGVIVLHVCGDTHFKAAT